MYESNHCLSDGQSGRFCVLTRQQYLEAGIEHTKNDRKITQDDQEEIQRSPNGHMCWWGPIRSLGSNWGQEARCLSNLLNHGLKVFPMTLLVKDHKTWSVTPPTRSVIGGNEGGNAGISEFISLVVAREQSGNMEINATNGLLADITDYNEELRREKEETSQLEEVQVQGGIGVSPMTITACSPFQDQVM